MEKYLFIYLFGDKSAPFLVPRCHNPENISTQKHPGHGTAMHSMCSDHSQEQSHCIHGHGISGRIPWQESHYYSDLSQYSSDQPNLPTHHPQDGRQRAGRLPARLGRRWYSQQTVTHAQIFHFWGWLKAAVSILCEIGFPPHDFMQQLSALNPHSAVWSFWNT